VTEPIASVARVVTLFEDRAEVERDTVTTVPAGLSVVRIGGVGPAIDDPSLRVSSDAGEIASSRVVREIRREGPDPAELEACRRAVTDATAALAALDAERERLEAESAREEGLATRWIEGMARTPAGDLAGWRRGWEALADGPSRRATAQRALRDRRRTAADELEIARARLQWASGERTREQTVVEVQIRVDAACDVRFTLRYLAPCAVWRPAHVARLAQDQLTLDTYGVAWNATGETWTDVRLRFSTARPGRAAEPPPLADDVLTLRAKTEEEKRTVHVEARDVDLSGVGVAGARAVDEMPGVEDGGEAQTLESTGTLPSDGVGAWFPVGERVLAAAVERCAWPERGEWVHLRARATATGGPILAGPVRLVRGAEVVGTSKLDFVPAGEAFELGFGPDDAVRVRRSVEEQRDTTPVVGTQKTTRTVKLHVANTGDERRSIVVIERIPVSEIADVSVAMLEDGGGTADRDGQVRFPVALEPGTTREIVYKWRLEAGAKVRLTLP
jgi:uncharacterized protein (TIGR02231 family)